MELIDGWIRNSHPFKRFLHIRRGSLRRRNRLCIAAVILTEHRYVMLMKMPFCLGVFDTSSPYNTTSRCRELNGPRLLEGSTSVEIMSLSEVASSCIVVNLRSEMVRW